MSSSAIMVQAPVISALAKQSAHAHSVDSSMNKAPPPTPFLPWPTQLTIARLEPARQVLLAHGLDYYSLACRADRVELRCR